MSFLQEVLEYNEELRAQGVTVVVGHQHGDDDQMNFIYTFGEEQHEMLIALEPTDYTEWNALREWLKGVLTKICPDCGSDWIEQMDDNEWCCNECGETIRV